MTDTMEPVDCILPIIPKIRDYYWGDTTFIPSLLGIESDETPKAELWFGTHPQGESTLTDGVPLSDHLSDHAEVFLGEQLLERYGKDLPFLLKVLAIARPLSLQVHPNSDQAARGFAEEIASHAEVPPDQWNYKDDRQKAEVLYALTPVTALCGFVPVKELVRHLEILIPKQLPVLFPFLCETGVSREDELIKRFFTTLYLLEPQQQTSLLAEFSDSLHAHPYDEHTEDRVFLTPHEIARLCLSLYPDDPAVFAPFFLNVIHLNPGEAIFLEPRTLHAYVCGHAVELMSNSDNVLRAGLTAKKVDIPELEKTLLFKPQQISACPQVRDGSRRINVLAPTDDFLLGVFDEGDFVIDTRSSIELLFCTSGTATIDAQGEKKEIRQGSCVVIAATVPQYRLKVTGTVFSASVPH